MLNGLRIALLLLVGVLLPVEYVSLFSPEGFPVGPTKAAMALLMAVALPQWLISSRRFPRSKKNAWVALLALSLTISTVATLFHGVPFRAVAPGMSTHIALLLFYVVISVSICSVRELDWFLCSFVLGGVLVGATALLGIGYVTESSEGVRLGGLGGNVNELGFNLGLVMPIAFSFVIAPRSRTWRMISIVAIVVGLIATVNTLSRTAYLVALVMWIYGMIRFSRLDLLRYTAVGLVVFLIGINFLPAPARQRLDTLSSRELSRDGSTQTRLMLNELGLRAFLSNPIIGVGTHRFPTWARQSNRTVSASYVVHNAYLEVAAEEGLLGLIPFLAITWLTWREFGASVSLARRGERAGLSDLRPLRLRALLLQVAFLGVMVGHLAQTSFSYKGTWLMPALSTVVLNLVRQRVTSHAGSGSAEVLRPLHAAAAMGRT